MEMKNILGLSERLLALIEKAEAEAQEIVSKTQKEAEVSLADVKEQSEKRRLRAQRRTGLDEFLVEAEAEAKKEAKKVTKDYEKRVMEIKNIPAEKIDEVVEYILKEVLPE